MNLSRMHLFSLFLLIVLALTPSALHAQIGLYGTLSGASFSNAPKDLGYGGMVGAYKTTGHFIGTGLDLRGTFVGRDGFHYYTYAIGPRVSFKPRVLPLTPYVEGLIGLANYNSGKNTSSTNHFNYQIVGGLDATILPHIDWRLIDVGYSSTTANQSIKTVTYSTGLVIRIW
jgi:hypothetical protein